MCLIHPAPFVFNLYIIQDIFIQKVKSSRYDDSSGEPVHRLVWGREFLINFRVFFLKFNINLTYAPPIFFYIYNAPQRKYYGSATESRAVGLFFRLLVQISYNT